ncbi:MAG TPA: ATP-binding protein [Chloroflexia bacterium]|jgi:AAA+ superfamily predicted ATPase
MIGMPQHPVAAQGANQQVPTATQQYLSEARPAWLKEIQDRRSKEGRNVFLLHFNIHDLVFDPEHVPGSPGDLKTLTEMLFLVLRSRRNAVLYYSLHSGIEAYKGDAVRTARSFQPNSPEPLWQNVADQVARDPFPLMPQGGPLDEPGPPSSWRTPRLAFQLLDRVLSNPYTIGNAGPAATMPGQTAPSGPAALSIGLIVDYLHHLTPPREVPTRHEVSELVETLQSWSTDPNLHKQNHIVILLTTEQAAVHPELQGTDSRVVPIRVSRPVRDERAAFLRWLSGFTELFPVLARENVVDEMANLASGLNYMELRDFAHNMQSDTWRAALNTLRADAINRASRGLLVPHDSRYGLRDVAGYQYARDYVEQFIPDLKQGSAEITGILFTGPPGTGKSFYAGALARDAGVPMLRMGDIRGSYVGETERNLSLVLEVARNMAPVIIFIDEIDQAFASRQATGAVTDSGVEQRVLGRILQFMDDPDNRGRVFWIAASNRPDMLDAALLSRFKLVVPFLLPDRTSCFDLLVHKLPAQAGFSWIKESLTPEVQQAIDGIVGKFSGRELETIVQSAKWAAKAAGQADLRLISAKHLVEAIAFSSIGHDENAYLHWALLALQSVKFDSPRLIEAVRATLPFDTVNRILPGNSLKIDKAALSQIIKDMQRWIGR